jgi:hypothetical protein
LRNAEFGFFGVVVYTRVHTPRRCGEPASAGAFVFLDLVERPFRTNCCIVGTSKNLIFVGDPSLSRGRIQIFCRTAIYVKDGLYNN